MHTRTGFFKLLELKNSLQTDTSVKFNKINYWKSEKEKHKDIKKIQPQNVTTKLT